ncbi:Hypothetical protein SMAX5B_005536 [Scophthalmus maximus]|uniref:Uncharacterized protein n=1 Tax=Scophthalmus maximus TaxID=52904 RepID=A0A2U9AWE7_SCOMX|nr:Hypothetical protein SMAX5B_005536 [Scophthalmus maximus]
MKKLKYLGYRRYQKRRTTSAILLPVQNVRVRIDVDFFLTFVIKVIHASPTEMKLFFAGKSSRLPATGAGRGDGAAAGPADILRVRSFANLIRPTTMASAQTSAQGPPFE